MMSNIEKDRHEALSKAFIRKIGVKKDTADDLAIRVLNYFGYDEEVIDNALDQDDRRLFYFLQDVSILRTAWEEAILASGRTWRIFYWYLNLDEIEESANEVDDPVPEPGLYDALPQDVWSRDEIKEEGS
jgi:hypothetical protein